ncbi:hypothetical protein TcWFU_003387 [Taenia crassiceps]|uniref:Uncharacterized protein n=1 Tax=Taenia crassiceps TaxID=6207 RepID=A0ABR4QKW2_9CEST
MNLRALCNGSVSILDKYSLGSGRQIICSANVTATSLAKEGFKGPFYVIGQSGLGEELDKAGIEHFGIGPDDTTVDEFDASHLRANA